MKSLKALTMPQLWHNSSLSLTNLKAKSIIIKLAGLCPTPIMIHANIKWFEGRTNVDWKHEQHTDDSVQGNRNGKPWNLGRRWALDTLVYPTVSTSALKPSVCQYRVYAFILSSRTAKLATAETTEWWMEMSVERVSCETWTKWQNMACTAQGYHTEKVKEQRTQRYIFHQPVLPITRSIVLSTMISHI